jgi:hypothetical protein
MEGVLWKAELLENAKMPRAFGQHTAHLVGTSRRRVLCALAVW